MAVLSEIDGRYFFNGKKVRVEVRIDSGRYFADVLDESNIRVHREDLPDNFRLIGRAGEGTIDWDSRDRAALQQLVDKEVVTPASST